jgi:hypothetical protein
MMKAKDDGVGLKIPNATAQVTLRPETKQVMPIEVKPLAKSPVAVEPAKPAALAQPVLTKQAAPVSMPQSKSATVPSSAVTPNTAAPSASAMPKLGPKPVVAGVASPITAQPVHLEQENPVTALAAKAPEPVAATPVAGKITSMKPKESEPFKLPTAPKKMEVTPTAAASSLVAVKSLNAKINKLDEDIEGIMEMITVIAQLLQKRFTK